MWWLLLNFILAPWAYSAELSQPWPKIIGEEGLVVRDVDSSMTVKSFLKECLDGVSCVRVNEVRAFGKANMWFVGEYNSSSERLFITPLTKPIQVDWYVVLDGEVFYQASLKGGRSATYQSPLDTVELRVPVGKVFQLVGRFSSVFPFTPRFQVGDLVSISKYDYYTEAFRYLYYGIILCFIVYNLALFARGNYNYLFYVIFCSGLALPGILIDVSFFMNFTGIESLAGAISHTSSIGLVLLLNSIYQLHERHNNLWLLGSSLAIYGGCIGILTFILPQYTILFSAVVFVPFAVYSIGICVYNYNYKPFESRTLLLGYFSLFVGILVFLLSRMGYLPQNQLTRESYKLAQIIEVFLVSWALGHERRQIESRVAFKIDNEESFRTMVGSLQNQVFGAINIIAMNVEDLKLRAKSDKILKIIMRLERGLAAIRSVGEEMRDVGRLGGDKSRIELEAISIHEVFDELAFMFQQGLDAKHLTLNTKIDSDSLWVIASRSSLIHQVLGNILSNAIKFSPDSSSIDLTAREMGDGVELSIRDYGVGIPQHLLLKIFDSKTVTTRQGTGGEKGTGFGLPLAASWVQAFGGEVRVFSKGSSEGSLSVGTEFTVILKKAKAKGGPRAA